MSAGSVAIALAARVERTGGLEAGLLAWRTLAGNARPGEVRARALLEALRCAAALGDDAALGGLARAWRDAGEGAWDEDVSRACLALSARGSLPRAVELARAEVARRRSARACYLLARCLETARDPAAEDAFAGAAARAEEEGAGAIAAAARVRRIAWLLLRPAARREAAGEALKLDIARLAPRDRIVAARALLYATSRFARAGAIAALDGVVSGGDVELARRALSVLASYADEAGDALTALEIDRLLAAFGRDVALALAPGARDAMRAAAVIARASDAELDAALDEAARLVPSLGPLHRRARALLEGRDDDGGGGGAASWSRVLDAYAKVHGGDRVGAAIALTALAEMEERGEPAPRQAWSVVALGLVHEDAAVRAAAARFVEARTSRAGQGPPRGWLSIAGALAACGMADRAEQARRDAAAAGEPGADDALVVALTRKGWELAQAGDRSLAIAALREARALALRPSRPSPEAARERATRSP